MPYNSGTYGNQLWGAGGTTMSHRSLIRPMQLDSNGAYSFAQLNLDGYSGGFLQDGYLMGLVLTDGYDGGVGDTIHMDAHDGAINQIGTGQVEFAGNVDAKNGLDVTGDNLTVALDAEIDGYLTVGKDAVITGSLTVNGDTTFVNTEQMLVQDPVTVVNVNASELSTHFTGFSMRDEDGYYRTGWVFEEGGVDGYWGLSTTFNATDSDQVPDRAIAYVSAGDAYGDLSSTETDNSGADKVGVSDISGVAGTTVQEVLENLAGGSAELTGTSQTIFTVNTDASAGTDEDACLLLKGGDGTSLIDGYMCLITNSSTNDDFFQFVIRDDETNADAILHIGENGETTDVDSELFFNSGNGSDAYQASIVLDGDSALTYTNTQGHNFVGDVDIDNNLNVDGNGAVGGTLDVTGTFSADGDVNLGTDSADSVTVSGTITSDLLPTDDTYQLGDSSSKWSDGYFTFFTPTNYTPTDENSLTAHLQAIDDALADANIDLPRGVYDITPAEASADELDSSRTADSGDTVDVGSLTDEEFRDKVQVFLNGQFLANDGSSAADSASVTWDVARKTGSLSTLVFGGNIRRRGVVQIIYVS